MMSKEVHEWSGIRPRLAKLEVEHWVRYNHSQGSSAFKDGNSCTAGEDSVWAG